MRGNNGGPSPVSGSEQLLERIHNDDLKGRDKRVEELRQELIDKDLRLAELIAEHPDSPFDSRGDVLEACSHKDDALLEVSETLRTTIE